MSHCLKPEVLSVDTSALSPKQLVVAHKAVQSVSGRSQLGTFLVDCDYLLLLVKVVQTMKPYPQTLQLPLQATIALSELLRFQFHAVLHVLIQHLELFLE